MKYARALNLRSCSFCLQCMCVCVLFSAAIALNDEEIGISDEERNGMQWAIG